MLLEITSFVVQLYCIVFFIISIITFVEHKDTFIKRLYTSIFIGALWLPLILWIYSTDGK